MLSRIPYDGPATEVLNAAHLEDATEGSIGPVAWFFLFQQEVDAVDIHAIWYHPFWPMWAKPPSLLKGLLFGWPGALER